jgi:hypothetical protein
MIGIDAINCCVINTVPCSERMASQLSFKSLFPSGDIMISHQNILPRLHCLSLRGVPMNWIALLEQLSATAVFPLLHYLELLLFCAGGQAPTSCKFSTILTAFPNLCKLTVTNTLALGRYQRLRPLFPW